MAPDLARCLPCDLRLIPRVAGGPRPPRRRACTCHVHSRLHRARDAPRTRSPVPRSRKLLLFVLVGYLALPFDLVPDFIPVAGQLDDAIIVALVLRYFLRAGDEPMMRELWPGPEQSLALILRLARPRGSQPEPDAIV